MGTGENIITSTTWGMTNPEQEKVNNDWNAMAVEWDGMEPVKMYRNNFLKTLWETTGLKESDERVVIDFGCGTGLLTEAMRKLAPPSSKFICLDPATAMTNVVQEKIQARKWMNVQVHCVTLANNQSADNKSAVDLENLKGTVDLIVASSVMTFVPQSDLEATMKALGGFLKPGGLFVHSDWVEDSENHPDGYTEEKAKSTYALGGLQPKSVETKTFQMGEMEAPVLFGVAEKPSN